MNTTTLFQKLLLAGTLCFATTGAAALLISPTAGPTNFPTSNNNTFYVDFGTALPTASDTLNEFAIGDSLAMTFTLNFTGFNNVTNPMDSSLSFGFLSGTGNNGNSVAFANLNINNDSLNSATSSLLRSRSGSVYMGNSGTQASGNTPFSSGSLYTGPTTAGSYDASFSITKASETTFTFALGMGSVSQNQTLTITDAAILDSVITRLGFRNNNGMLTGANITDYSATFAAIPEPGTLVLLGVALGAVMMFRRRR